MESGGSGIATTQSHHQGRASEHEHGDASHVQQHGAHATGGREVGALLVHDVGLNGTIHLITVSLINLQRSQRRIVRQYIVISSDGEERVSSSVIACRSVGLHELVLAIINAGERSSVGEMPLGAAPRQSDLFTDLIPLLALAILVLLVQRELRHITFRRVT